MFKTRFLFNLIFTFVSVVFKVSDISNIADTANFVLQICQISEQQVESNSRAGMSEMGIAINGWTTNIETNKWRMKWLKEFFFSGKAVINEKFVTHKILFDKAKVS